MERNINVNCKHYEPETTKCKISKNDIVNQCPIAHGFSYGCKLQEEYPQPDPPPPPPPKRSEE